MLLFISVFISAQNQFPRIDRIVIDDKILNGQIDKYPITIYLKAHKHSNCNMGVYPVKGWYFYDKIKTKIPIVGIFDFNDMVLYNFQDTSKLNELLNFRVTMENYMEDIEHFKNLSGYNEKFVLYGNSFTWTNGKKTLSLDLYDEDLSVNKTLELLRFNSETAFDLNNIGGCNMNFTIKAHKEHKFIIEYEYASRNFSDGMCGGGIERGFMLLKFDKDFNLYSFQDFVYESCNYLIGNEGQKEISKNLVEYYCEDLMNEKSYILVVDTENIEIKMKEKN